MIFFKFGCFVYNQHLVTGWGQSPAKTAFAAALRRVEGGDLSTVTAAAAVDDDAAAVDEDDVGSGVDADSLGDVGAAARCVAHCSRLTSTRQR